MATGEIKASELTPIADNIAHTVDLYCFVGGTPYKVSRDQMFGYKRYTSVSTSFTISKPAKSTLERIRASLVSGGGSLKFGTTLGGEEIANITEFPARINPDWCSESAETIYVTPSGGVFNINVQIINDDI